MLSLTFRRCSVEIFLFLDQLYGKSQGIVLWRNIYDTIYNTNDFGIRFKEKKKISK